MAQNVREVIPEIDDRIAQLTNETWLSVLGSEAERSDAPIDPAGERMTASIIVGGSWTGAIRIDAPVSAAREFAVAMFLTEELEDGEVIDAFGEIINVIGGAFKSLLVPPTTMSIPEVLVVPALEAAFEEPDSEVSFAWHEQSFRISVVSN